MKKEERDGGAHTGTAPKRHTAEKREEESRCV